MNFSIRSNEINIHAYKAQSIPVVSSVTVSPAMAIASTVQLVVGAGRAFIGRLKGKEKSDLYSKGVEQMRMGGKNLLYSVINTFSLGFFGLYMKKQFQKMEESGLYIGTMRDMNISKAAIWFSGINDHVETPSERKASQDWIDSAWSIETDESDIDI